MFGLWRGPGLVRWGSAGIALLYGVLAVAYALNMPLWQNPDEPAHFNYVRDIAEGRGLPVLQPGDYDQQAIEALTAARFGAGGSVDGLRYEGHQPPLYYLLAAVVVRAGNGLPSERQVMAVRLLSIVLGLALLGVTYGAVARLYPDQPWLRLGVLGLVGLLPQHVAMLAAVNNDVLAEALVAAVLLCSLLLASVISARLAAVTGVLLGLALITKTTAYGVALLPGLALYLAARAPGMPKAALLPLLPLLQRWLVVYGVALFISAPWFLSNLAVYGWPDALGLLRHGEVVAGQPQAGAVDGGGAPGCAGHAVSELLGAAGLDGCARPSRGLLAVGGVERHCGGGLAVGGGTRAGGGRDASVRGVVTGRAGRGRGGATGGVQHAVPATPGSLSISCAHPNCGAPHGGAA